MMGVVPGSIETDHQPPMAVPLRHFVVALGFLLAGSLLGLGIEALGGYTTAGHVHLLLAGWVCITIMGAMTQLVPVWSGTQLYSRRLASRQLVLVTSGLVGFAVSLVSGWLPGLPVFGSLLLLGFWTFVYNVGRTLASVDTYDVTERHFALALVFFLLVTTFGLLLAVDMVVPVVSSLPVGRGAAIETHATLAVFGAVLTTVLGALYQLGTMFTQTELHGVDQVLRRVEESAYPAGVVVLAAGRLLENVMLSRAGGVLLLGGLAAFGVILARRLVETRVPWTPMLSRYAVATAAVALWVLVTIPTWLSNPIAPGARFGGAGAHLLLLGVVGFVVFGTLYHVVPFIVWVHRYSDRLGYEEVPMIDDLYSDRLAAIDFGCFLGGTALLVLGETVLDAWWVTPLGGGLVVLGSVCFVANLLRVIANHSPTSLRGIVLSRGSNERPQDP